MIALLVMAGVIYLALGIAVAAAMALAEFICNDEWIGCGAVLLIVGVWPLILRLEWRKAR